MYAAPLPSSAEPLLPAGIRADGGVRLRFGRAGGALTRRLDLAESGGYRARIPHAYGESCEAVLINTGGGMAGGDRMSVSVDVEQGADAVVTTQAAEKIYRSQGAPTRISTRLTIGPGARLDWLPQETILYDASRLRRSLEVELDATAEFVACESLVFGRVAMGERLRRGELSDSWRIRRGGRLVFAEELRLADDIAARLARPAIGGGTVAQATLLAFRGGLADRLSDLRERLASFGAAVEAGAGMIGEMLVIRMVSTDAGALRLALVMLLPHISGRALPRNWSI